MIYQNAGAKYMIHWPVWVPEIFTLNIPWIKAYLDLRIFCSNHTLVFQLNHLK